MMRHFHRLPPLLRAASILGLLLPVASLALLTTAMIATIRAMAPPFSQPSWDSFRILGVAVNLSLLGLACAYIVNIYNARFRQPDRGPFLLSTWQSQARTLALLAALPLCALALTLAIPSDSPAFLLVAMTSILAAIMLVVAYARNLQAGDEQAGANTLGPMDAQRRPPFA